MLAVATTSETVADNACITSLSGKIWRLLSADPVRAQRLAAAHNLEPLVAQILTAREAKPEQVAAFLQPKLREWLPDPFKFRDMDKAVARIVHAVENGEKVALFGDYDVDGATSTALMARFLRAYGLQPTIYIPDRISEGYGPNTRAFQQLIDDGHTLIITLDCGVLAYEPIKLAKSLNIDVVVLDHHMAAPELPEACAIVNPNRLDDDTGFRYLAAVGVTFVTLVALQQKLKRDDVAVDLLGWLDLVALGTVCDVVPLIELNRAFVAQGLKIMARRSNAGISALCDAAGMDTTPSAYHLGFVLGPRVNAGGRLASSQIGAQLLSSDDAVQCHQLAEKLDRYNRDRQAMEREAVEQAIGMVLQDESAHSYMIILAHRDWHPGVIGLIAARLKERFYRPTAIIAIDGNGKGKASARSITGVNLGAMIMQAKLDGLLLEGGGHAMAAGFSLKEEQIAPLHAHFTKELQKQFGPVMPPQEIRVDATLGVAAINMPAAQQLQMLEPFGAANPSPKLLLGPVRLQGIDIVKEKHLRLRVTDMTGALRASSMLFSAGGTPLHRTLESMGPQHKLALLGSLKINSWQGREEAQFLTDDVALMEQDHV